MAMNGDRLLHVVRRSGRSARYMRFEIISEVVVLQDRVGGQLGGLYWVFVRGTFYVSILLCSLEERRKNKFRVRKQVPGTKLCGTGHPSGQLGHLQLSHVAK